MRDFAIWYFETGWIINTIIGMIIGVYSGVTRKWKVLIVYCILSLLLGAVTFYLKNYY